LFFIAFLCILTILKYDCLSSFAYQDFWKIATEEKTMPNLMDRITVNPKQCDGRPCIRGMRIRVVDVLDLFAAGLSAEQIIDEMPDLELEDLQASLQFDNEQIN